MSDRLRFGLVGAGAIAQTYAQAFSDSQEAVAVAVADVRPEAAEALAERLSCAAFPDHQAMLDDGSIDAVVIATPPATHPEICIAAVSRGIPVLCEKPLAVDVASARGMVEAANKAGVLLTMASKFRYVDDVIRAKSIVASGILGEIILFENTFTSRVDMGGRWNSKPQHSGGGVLIDNGTHSVDLMRYFLGPIAEVQAVEGKNVQGLQVEDTVRLFVRSEGGVMGSVDLSWSLNKELESYVNIYGSHGTIQVGWKSSRYRQSSSSDWVEFGHGYDKLQAFSRKLENFCQAVRGERRLLIDAEDAIASVEVIEKAYASLEDNRWITV
ncbi:MAG: Gfo/Idh/MocA family oxidoreductase [Acidobacteriota bacterium]